MHLCCDKKHERSLKIIHAQKVLLPHLTDLVPMDEISLPPSKGSHDEDAAACTIG